ncbi:hypothetical protein [Kitasatospora sp. NPDC058190]|uniref:hypothetical protein n=1 Tax=Kitasatospora sp. NPDC058190 TaxID=3346371 RepID=UPI0036DDF5C8
MRIGAAPAFAPARLGDERFDGTPLFLLVVPFGIVAGIVLLLAPPDAVDLSPRGRNETVLTALALAVPLSAFAVLRNQYPFTSYVPRALSDLEHTVAWPVAVLSLALLLHLGARRPDRLRTVGIALAALPRAAIIPTISYRVITPPYLWIRSIRYYLPGNIRVVLVVLTAATLLAALRHVLRRSRRTDPPGPA